MTPPADKSSTQLGPAGWPVVTAYAYLDPKYKSFANNGANPVHEGVGHDGQEVGYFSGGRMPGTRDRIDLWLRLDPEQMRRMLAEYDARLAALPRRGTEAPS